MPTVPRYVQTETPKGYRQGGITGQGSQALANAYGKLGNALGNAGDTLGKIAMTELDSMNKAVCEEAQSAYEDLMQVHKQSQEERKGKNALGDDQGDKGVFDSTAQYHKDTVASLLQGKNEKQRLYLQNYFDQRGRQFGDWAFEYEKGQRNVYEKGQADAFQTSQINRAINNPGELKAAMANMEMSIREYNASQGVSQEETDLQIQAGWDKAGAALVKNALAQDNVRLASSILKEHAQDFSPSLVADCQERIKNKQEILEAKARAEAERAERARERAAAQVVQQRTTDIAAGYEEVYRNLPSDWTEDRKQAHMTKLVMDQVKDPKVLGGVMKSMAATMKQAEMYHKASLVEDQSRADTFVDGLTTVSDVLPDGSTVTRPMTAAEKASAVQNSPDLPDTSKKMAMTRIMATPEFKAEMERASADGLAQFRAWFDNHNGASEVEARAMIGELGISGKDVDKALDYRGKHQEYSMDRLRPIVKKVTGKDDADTVSKYFTAIMKNPRIKKGEKLSDDDLKGEVYTLSSKGNVRSDTKHWYDSTVFTDRSSSTFLDAVTSGKGNMFNLEVPAIQVPVLNVEAENMFPGVFQKANAEVKQLVREVLWNNKQGITTQFTEREKQILQNAGFGRAVK